MTELPPVRADPAALKAWVESLGRDDLMALAQQLTSGALTGGLGLSGQFGEVGPRNRKIDLPPPADEPSLLTLTIELRGAKPRIWRRLSLPGGSHAGRGAHPVPGRDGMDGLASAPVPARHRTELHRAVLRHRVRRGRGRRRHA